MAKISIILAIHDTYFFVLAVLFFGLGVTQLIKIGLMELRNGGNGWRAAGREARSARMALVVAFGVSFLVRSQLT